MTHLLRSLSQFPFFCSDREYIIARRIWKLGGAYYCVTKVKLDLKKKNYCVLFLLGDIDSRR